MQDRVTVITGAGSGIGLAMAHRFAAEGDTVVVADIDAESVQRAVSAIRETGAIALGEVVDVTQAEEIRVLLQGARDALGRVDVLCNNAGIFEGLLSVAEIEPATWARVLEVNLTGQFLGCHFAVPIMLAQGSGIIINMSSIAGVQGGRSGVAYTAAKFGVIGLTQNIAARYGSRGIRCNALCPGPVRTQIGANQLHTEATAEYRKTMSSSRAQAIAPEEIGNVAAWLASDDARYVNGQALTING